MNLRLTLLSRPRYNSKVCSRRIPVVGYFKSKPVQTVLRWQVYVTLICAAIAGFWIGERGLISALLGGLVNIVAHGVYAWVVSISDTRSPGGVLRTMIRAEASKIALIVIQMWLVLTTYKNVAGLAFFITFLVTVLAFSLALAVKEKPQAEN
jgi:ATP synthase protein I